MSRNNTCNNLSLESSVAIEALRWIDDILKKHNISYQVTGGLAAKVYGSLRPLVDIDIDVSNNDIAIILPEIEPYLIFGPERYQDEMWDILLLTLDYHGQLIDISGADDGKVYNLLQNDWEACVVNLSAREFTMIENISVPVINKFDLVQYKSKIRRPVDLEDLEFLNKNTN